MCGFLPPHGFWLRAPRFYAQILQNSTSNAASKSSLVTLKEMVGEGVHTFLYKEAGRIAKEVESVAEREDREDLPERYSLHFRKQASQESPEVLASA
ncbi:hypothetical protein AXG93_4525s1000 [Marchantia polymorpha subsp. ruderalis]|uniref:Uncharacterized protein n=1 Tax=Marchantia polymorpha subsp. ruderalis TaxID=1480154 RepID=A0A176WGL3_MARPO|nr:hypothetical protein AXG93_4525s1000 [Marchantia polymorpha subsp. ruderalis]